MLVIINVEFMDDSNIIQLMCSTWFRIL